VEAPCHLRADALGRASDKRGLAGKIQVDAHGATLFVFSRFMFEDCINIW
jgi:hypothetical protein